MRISWLALAAIGCSGGSPAEAPPPTPPAKVAAANEATPPAAAPAKEKVAPKLQASPEGPSKEQLAEFRKRMNAGWKLQQEERWAESVPEFEAALVAVPSEQRALTELGWSAMKAGDFDKARRADEEAIRVAIDKQVKAQGLYNLGQVQEKSGDKEGAHRSYLASIALRPNKTVESALARLGKSPRTEPKFCADAAKACDCIVAHAFGAKAEGVSCTEMKAEGGNKLTLVFPSVSGFHVFRVTGEHATWDYVLDEKSQLVAVVGGSYDHAGRTETVQLLGSTLKSVAGKAVVQIETMTKASATRPIADAPDGKDVAVEIEDVETRAATVCVIGVGGAPTRCPLRDVPLLHSVVVERVGKSGPRTETHVELTISDDGVATVKQVKGPSDAALSALAGPHRLW